MKSVLIFDPDLETCARTGQVFEGRGYVTTVCGDYDTAVGLANIERYSCVSFHMHDTEEVQLALRLRTLQPDAPCNVC